jgi:hypothetical protein
MNHCESDKPEREKRRMAYLSVIDGIGKWAIPPNTLVMVDGDQMSNEQQVLPDLISTIMIKGVEWISRIRIVIVVRKGKCPILPNISSPIGDLITVLETPSLQSQAVDIALSSILGFILARYIIPKVIIVSDDNGLVVNNFSLLSSITECVVKSAGAVQVSSILASELNLPMPTMPTPIPIPIPTPIQSSPPKNDRKTVYCPGDLEAKIVATVRSGDGENLHRLCSLNVETLTADDLRDFYRTLITPHITQTAFAGVLSGIDGANFSRWLLGKRHGTTCLSARAVKNVLTSVKNLLLLPLPPLPSQPTPSTSSNLNPNNKSEHVEHN